MKNYKLVILSLLLFSTVSLFAQEKASIVLNVDQAKDVINKNIYGHFSEHLGHCIYGGYWVGEDSPIPNTRGIRNDVVEALKEINIPNLRWPGGCFADEYHWKDGIGPRDQRPEMVNTHWGGVTEDNSFGTHEFMDLCQQLNTEPYICGNVGSGTVQEMSQWVEYLNFDGISPMSELRKKNGHPEAWNVKFWGVGNESWGCGGNMTPEYYADLYRRYATFCKDYGDKRLYKIAGGSNSTDYNWTEVLMKNIPLRLMQGISLHYYTVPGTWRDKGSATDFDEQEYFTTLKKSMAIDQAIQRHSTIMDRYDPYKRVGLVIDEWGAWYNVEPGTNPGFLFQQSTLRDAMVAGISLNIFNQHCDRVKMANIAQTINVLQALIFTKDEKIVLTPTYWVYDMYKVHQDATLIPIEVNSPDYEIGGDKIPAVNASASIDKEGKVHITLVNINPHEATEMTCDLRGSNLKKVTSGEIITAPKLQTYNSFDQPDNIRMDSFDGGKLKGQTLSVTLPAKSVVMIELQ
ncbi:MAG TPA: alpha-N-arabinofuranosidase [Bacteroidales bacterium]|nr:alpha-N-arabinofuranosidase [Bacteroidales bacterium]